MNIVINVATTWISLPCSKAGGFVAPRQSIWNFLNKNLCEYDWDLSMRRYVLRYRYYYYDNDNEMLYLPRYLLEKLLNYLGDTEYDLVQVEPVPSRKVHLRIRDKFKPRENQPSIIEYMTNPDSGFKAIALMTGGGKTFCAECSIAQLGRATLVVLSSLIDQWHDSILEHTNISEDDLYIVRGYDSLRKLWKMRLQRRHSYKPKIILFAARTLHLYAVEYEGLYQTLPDYSQFQKQFGIGIKVVDECHLGFHTTTQIDLRSNIETNIYLSATYQRSNQQCKKIFDSVFPASIKYGEQFVKRYTRVYVVKYSLQMRDTGFKTAKGYNHSFYENCLLRSRNLCGRFFKEIIRICLQRYFLQIMKEDQRCLILCQTRKFCEELHKFLVTDMRGVKCSTYFSGDRNVDTDDIFSSTVIVSTIKSASTGLDIKGLKTAINTVSFASSPQASQVMGRLRQIPDEDTVFVDLWNVDISAHAYHKTSRIQAYGHKALSLEDVTLY